MRRGSILPYRLGGDDVRIVVITTERYNPLHGLVGPLRERAAPVRAYLGPDDYGTGDRSTELGQSTSDLNRRRLGWTRTERRSCMGLVTCQISVSLDGYVAGPNQSLENPIGEGGMRLHEWVFPTEGWRRMQGLDGGEATSDSRVITEVMSGNGAYIMGRNMFGGGPGPWDESWTGWWGDDPPYHVPVFVLTSHPREPVTKQGGTTFTFVTDGIDSALTQAQAVAGEGNVSIAGGASTVRQFLRAGHLDELYLHLVPIVLGSGERLLEDVGEPRFELLKVVDSPTVTHLKYRVAR